MKKLLSLLAVSLVFPLALRAELELPAIIDDHMVLQQNLADPIWGSDTAGTKITVSFVGKNYSTVAGDVFNGALGRRTGGGSAGDRGRAVCQCRRRDLRDPAWSATLGSGQEGNRSVVSQREDKYGRPSCQTILKEKHPL